ncbi:MAG: OprD family outer membrane porin, partial [Woeseiaceae bacterium]
DYEIQKPFGGTPGFTSNMLFDFDRAREEAFRIGLSQNFAKYGFPGASLSVHYTKGRNAATDLGAPLADENEIDVTADFRPPDGLLKGLWLRIRYGDADRGSPMADRRDIRIILNYTIGALQER